MRSLLVLHSYHHNNTEKIARVFAEVLGAQIKTPGQVDPGELSAFDLVGFGSGIYGDQHHPALLGLADRLPRVADGEAFIFSTSGMGGEAKIHRDHSPLRERLESRGYTVIDEFNCPGYDTNTSFDSGILLAAVSAVVRLIGGINKGRPNQEDLKQAETFAQSLLQRIGG